MKNIYGISFYSLLKTNDHKIIFMIKDKKNVFNFHYDMIFKNNICEVHDKGRVTLNKIFKQFISYHENAERKDFIMKIECVDKLIEINYEKDNEINKKTVEQLESENSTIKQILIVVKDKVLTIALEKKIQDLKMLFKERILNKINNPTNQNILEDIRNDIYEASTSPFIIDIFENALIETVLEKYDFKDFNNYIHFYLNDNLKKMREANPNKDIRIIDICRKQVEDYMVNLKEEIRDLYLVKQKLIREANGNTNNDISKSTTENEEKDKKYFEELTITCIIAKKVNVNLFQELDLSQFYVLNENVLIILTALKANNSVQKLILTTNKLGNEGAWGLPRIFLFNKNLNHIDISSNGLDDGHLKLIAEGFNNLCLEKINLKHLNISSNQTLTKDCAEYIAKIIDKTDCLASLNISKINISTGFSKIIDAFEKKIETNKQSTIKSLNAFSNQIDELSIKKLSFFLMNPLCCLSLLVLTDNNLANDAGKALFQGLIDNTSIKELYLHECNLDDNLESLIITLLKTNHTIRELSLYNNKFSATCVKKFVEALASITNDVDIEMLDYDHYEKPILGRVNYELRKFDVSKSNSNKDNLSKFDEDLLKYLRMIKDFYKKMNKRLILDLTYIYKIDTEIETELGNIDYSFLKLIF